jgi:PadR family transcriptional regulator, regulatory protein AphA
MIRIEPIYRSGQSSDERWITMDVKTLCLGVLTEGDKTGYEIKQRFEEAFAHFFGAGYGSIYPALAELTRKDLVTCRSVEQDKRPDKKVYSLTAAGWRTLVDELSETAPRHKVRSEFLVLMYFAHLLPVERVRRIVDEMLARWEPLVTAIEGCLEGPEGCEHVSPGTRFAAGYGRAVLGAAMAYVREHKDGLLREIAERERHQPPEQIAAAE